jgi:hypothetical protein
VVDFTQPDIAKALEILQAVSPGSVIGGLNAHFFNLTWDYSAPTDVTSFVVPQIVNIIIDGVTQQVQWQKAGGDPLGYRIEVVDPVTGITYNRFTIDHPNNPQGLTQFKLNPLDYANTRDIIITPFGGLGDGPSYVITNVSLSGSGSNSNSNSSYVFNSAVNGLIVSGQIITRYIFDQGVFYAQNMVPSQAWIDNPPATDMVFSIQKFSYVDGSQDAGEEIGCLVFAPGTHIGTITTIASLIFNQGEVLKTIGSSEMGNGVGICVTYSGVVL